MKVCTACGVEKSLDDFHAHPRGLHGRTSKCKPCVSAYNKARYARNGEAMRATMKAWRDAKRASAPPKPPPPSPEERKAARRAYFEKYRAENKSLTSQRIATWKAANREKVCHYSATRRARLKGALGNHTYADWLNTLRIWNWACAYCGSRDQITKDHAVPISRGGSDYIGNIVPACLSCNSAKCDRTITEWRHGWQRPSTAATASRPVPPRSLVRAP